MNKKKISIAITGGNGRMGKKTIKVIKNFSKTVFLKYIITKKQNIEINNSYFNSKIKLINNINNLPNDFDVLIDFSHPNSTIEYLNFCKKYNKSIVIGTTGFNEKQMIKIKKFSKNIKIIISPNFSIGINIILQLVKIITKTIGNNADINIVETHHRYKKDIPSGTALEIGKKIIKALKVYKTHNQESIKDNKDIVKFSSIRAGDIIGEHLVMFTSIGEKIEILHKAYNRTIFSDGAIHAAIWLNNKNENGLYSMEDVLSLSKL